VADSADLARLLVAIAAGDRALARTLLDAVPSLVTARLARRDEFFIDRCHAQVYEGDTALHAAAFAYDCQMARDLVARGAGIRARNRRGAEPLHAAVIGEPGTANWNPARQRAVIGYLIGVGADPDAAAPAVTPRIGSPNRCSAMSRLPGPPPTSPGQRYGSTPSDLARWTTGRGGRVTSGQDQQRIIIDISSTEPHLTPVAASHPVHDRPSDSAAHH
jgi:hypothetical protein